MTRMLEKIKPNQKIVFRFRNKTYEALPFTGECFPSDYKLLRILKENAMTIYRDKEFYMHIGKLALIQYLEHSEYEVVDMY